MDADLVLRIERLEAIEAIRQLASRYALAIDVRDPDALMELFLEEVQVGRDRFGRAALKEWFDDILRNNIKQTAHIVMNHVIEFDAEDEAYGVVYCRAEHELGDRFVVQQDDAKRFGRGSQWRSQLVFRSWLVPALAGRHWRRIVQVAGQVDPTGPRRDAYLCKSYDPGPWPTQPGRSRTSNREFSAACVQN